MGPLSAVFLRRMVPTGEQLPQPAGNLSFARGYSERSLPELPCEVQSKPFD
jgi:hypothetical protein